MALPPTEDIKRQRLHDILKDAPAKEVGRVLQQNPQILNAFQIKNRKMSKPEFKQLISDLNNTESPHHQSARNFVGNIASSKQFEQLLDKINTKKLEFGTKHLRDFAKEEGREGLWDKLIETGRNLNSKKIIRASFKDAPEVYALSTSAVGMTVGERQALLANIVLPVIQPYLINGFVSSFMLAASPANAALTDAPMPERFGERNPLEISVSAPPTEGSIQAYAAVRPNFEAATKKFDTLENNRSIHVSAYYYSPFLVKHLEKSSEARKFVKWITEAADKCGLDPVRFTNQMYRESAQFNPKYVYGPDKSSAGAMGLGQQIASTGKMYGLKGNDFFNPYKSINVAAEIMCDLKEKYFDDQGLAEIGYNGGEGAIHFVQKELGRKNITYKDWMAFMKDRRLKLPSKKSGAWQNETYKYVGVIDNSGWKEGHLSWAKKQQSNGLPHHMAFINDITPIKFQTADTSESQELGLYIPDYKIPITYSAPDRS